MRLPGSGPRIHDRELLDEPRQEPDELAASLRQVAQANRLVGGTRALRRHLAHHLDRTPRGPSARRHRVSTVLDVGTGNGELAWALEQWSISRSTPVRVVGVDFHRDVIRVAGSLAADRGWRAQLVRGDAMALPFADDSFDVVTCTLTLHHFGDEDAIRALGEMARVARGVVLVNDLERRPLNYWAARGLSWTLWRQNRLTRHDGPLSVLRSFTSRELLDLGQRAGLLSPTVRRHVPFRLVLEGQPTAARFPSATSQESDPIADGPAPTKSHEPA